VEAIDGETLKVLDHDLLNFAARCDRRDPFYFLTGHRIDFEAV